LRHENIIQVIDCGRHDDVAYIAMEFVEGMDLRQWIDAHGTPPLEMTLLMLHDLARGLEHAHSHRIIHRDIKPANLMLTPEGKVKIMDFGLARSGSETSTQMTMVGSVMGTPAYMSPEQATGETVDERADIFSAGVVAYELLGGKRPFEGESYSTVLRSILTVEPRDLTQFNPLVTPEVARIVRGMLQKDVSKRHATIVQVREEIGDAIEQMGLTRWRDLLREYVADPVTVGERWRKKRLARHLDQGMYFENMGLGKIDDALLEFRRVLHLDPGNAAGREHVARLETERDKLVASAAPAAPPAEAPAADQTVVLPPPQPIAAAPAPPPPPAPAPPPPPPASRPAASMQSAAEHTMLIPPDDDPSLPPSRQSPPAGPSAASRLRVPLIIVGGLLVVAVAVAGAIRFGTSRDPAPEPDQAPRPSLAITPPATPVPAPDPDSPEAPASEVAATGSDTPKLAAEPPMAQAQSLYAASKYADAAAVLRRGIADRSIPRAELRSARELMARAYARAGRRSDATAVYVDILKETPGFTPNSSESNNADLAAFGAAQDQLKPAEKPAPAAGGPATLVVRAAPFASALLIDGEAKDANKSQFRVTVPAGRHVITIKHPSLGEKVWTEDLSAGETRELSYDFIKAGAGRISVTAEGGWAEIYIDGQPTQRTTPAVIEGVLPGEHVVSLVSVGFNIEGGPRLVQVKVGEQVSVQFKLKPKK
jgi:hypothetical protein